MRTAADLIRDLEQLGETTVRTRFLNGDYKAPELHGLVKEWLSSKESKREAARAEEGLSNSRSALHIARSANKIAIAAIVIAIIAIVVTIIIAWLQRK